MAAAAVVFDPAAYKQLHGWACVEFVAAREYGPGPGGRGGETILSEETACRYECGVCGVSHSFTPATTEADIVAFLEGHEHGDFRLPPDHPAEEAALTAAQNEDAVTRRDISQLGPKECEVVLAQLDAADRAALLAETPA